MVLLDQCNIKLTSNGLFTIVIVCNARINMFCTLKKGSFNICPLNDKEYIIALENIMNKKIT